MPATEPIPTMPPPPAPPSHERVMEVLADALELAPAERGTFLARACAGDAALRAEVDRLLGREVRAAQELATAHGSSALLDALAPAQIGRASGRERVEVAVVCVRMR